MSVCVCVCNERVGGLSVACKQACKASHRPILPKPQWKSEVQLQAISVPSNKQTVHRRLGGLNRTGNKIWAALRPVGADSGFKQQTNMLASCSA